MIVIGFGVIKQIVLGRKKKDKEKAGIVMIGGMAMMAMMAQMFMGKILMLAGAAFLMSKVALFFSVLVCMSCLFISKFVLTQLNIIIKFIDKSEESSWS